MYPRDTETFHYSSSPVLRNPSTSLRAYRCRACFTFYKLRQRSICISYAEGDWILEASPASEAATPAASAAESKPNGKRFRHGKGTFADGSFSYVGEWDHDLMHGKGRPLMRCGRKDFCFDCALTRPVLSGLFQFLLSIPSTSLSREMC